MAPLNIGSFTIPWIVTVRPENTKDMVPYNKQIPKTETLPKGWQKTREKRAVSCDIIFDQNISIKLRDGCNIFCDVLRPVTDEKVPAILCFSPFGKGGHGFYIYDNCPFRLGIPPSATSGLEKFESPDPAEWCPRGYAVVNIDVRGSWESEGNLYIEGSQPGVDAYDTIEAIAKMDWCNGNCSMGGNSWLATTQWTAAIQKPPSLKCIAPWEGFTDKYRQVVSRGGVPKRDFVSFIFDTTIRGRQKRENLAKALDDWPLMNDFWADKELDTSGIDIPIYALASYCSALHVPGSINGWNAAKSKDKWLRFHSTQEWFDLYTKAANDDLQRFFDRYLKGQVNGWEKTPKVRLSLLTYNDRFGEQPLNDLPFSHYPPKELEYKSLYLTSERKLLREKQSKSTSVSYQSDDIRAPAAEFVHVFKEKTVVAGFPKAKLHVSCDENDDLDIYLSIRKVGKDGKILEHINAPWSALPNGVNSQDDVPNTNTIKHLGPTGVLRASHRAQDPKKSLPYWPYHPHDKEEKITPGTIVEVEIGIWPMGIIFEAGEALMLRIQGHLDQCVEFPDHINPKPENLNRGKHNIHVGGEYASSLVIPVLPVSAIDQL